MCALAKLETEVANNLASCKLAELFRLAKCRAELANCLASCKLAQMFILANCLTSCELVELIILNRRGVAVANRLAG